MGRVFCCEQNAIKREDHSVSLRFACTECELGYTCSDSELGALMARRKWQPCRHYWTSLKMFQESEYWDEAKKYAKRLYQMCPRCGGTGSYSYCQMYGSLCFGCRGQKYVARKLKATLPPEALATLKEATVGSQVVLGMILYDVVSVTWAEKVRRRMVQLIQGAPAMPEYDAQIVVAKARVSGVEKRYWREVFAPDAQSSVTTMSNGVPLTGHARLQVQRVPEAWRGQEVTEEHLATIHEVNRLEAAKRDGEDGTWPDHA